MSFCTAINCMDGRTQLPVIKFLQKRFGAEYVDCITEAGPNKVLAEQTPAAEIEAIRVRLKITIDVHASRGIAVAGHHDCARNPTPREVQIAHTKKAVNFLRHQYADIEIIGLWVDENWQVEEIC